MKIEEFLELSKFCDENAGKLRVMLNRCIDKDAFEIRISVVEKDYLEQEYVEIKYFIVTVPCTK